MGRVKHGPSRECTCLLRPLAVVALDSRVVLRRFPAIEHAIIADGSHRAMAKLAPQIDRMPVADIIGPMPGGQNQHFPRIVNALVHVVTNQTRTSTVKPELIDKDGWIGARRYSPRGRELGDGERLGEAHLGRIESLLLHGNASRADACQR